MGVAVTAVVRTSALVSRQEHVDPTDDIEVEPGRAAERLGEAVTFRTVSARDEDWRPGEEFTRFRTWMETTYAGVFEALDTETVNDASLLMRWPGSDPSLGALVLMAHQDVVPVDEETVADWTHPPFSGAVADGYVWGRGALDQKLGIVSILEAVEWLLAHDFQPERTIYLAFGHDEEVTGSRGAKAIAELLAKRGTDIWMVLDEGGFRVSGEQALTGTETAYIAIAEKGYLTIELTATGHGGHSSAPVQPTAIGRLAAAVDALETHPFPPSLDGPVEYMLEYTAPHMDYAARLAVANRWLLGDQLLQQFESDPVGRATVRTTIAPTIIEAGIKDNVLPLSARAVVNFRIHSNDSVAGVLARAKEIIDDDGISIRVLGETAEPSPITDPEGEGFRVLARTIGEVTPGDVLVIPWSSIGATDSRHYAGLTDQILRYSHAKLESGDARRIHGVNERVRVDEVDEQVRFYVQLMRNAGH